MKNEVQEGSVVRLTGIQVKTAKGFPMARCDAALLIENQGLEENYHKGGPRQVSLMAEEAVESLSPLKGSGLCLEKFAANLMTKGLNYSRLKPGDRLTVGGALIEMTEVGKPCHFECDLFQQKSVCPLTTMSAFAIVIKSGQICVGDSIQMG